jgi:hypothetical protein
MVAGADDGGGVHVVWAPRRAVVRMAVLHHQISELYFFILKNYYSNKSY